jgi:hypothetical protein
LKKQKNSSIKAINKERLEEILGDYSRRLDGNRPVVCVGFPRST